MADLYTPSDATLEQLARNRAADAAAGRAALAPQLATNATPANPGLIQNVGNMARNIAGLQPTAQTGPGAIPDPPKPPTSVAAQPTVNAAATPSAVAPQAAKPAGTMSRAFTGAKSLLSVPGAAAIGGITGAATSLRDNGSGYRDEFNASVGAQSPLQTLGADTLRTLGNVGNAVTGGIAGRLGQGVSSLVSGGSFGEGFSAPSARDAFYEKQASGPVTNASKASQRVGKIAQTNPELFPGAAQPAPGLTGVTQQPTSVNGISQLTGGQFKTPMFTDDPARAAAEYGGKKNSLFSVVPNTVEADKSYLQGAFNQHINSGDLDRAAATAVTPQDRAALGIAYNQRQQAQAQAAQEDPIRRMLAETLEKATKQQGGGIRDHAFGGPLRGRGATAQGGGEAANLQGVAGMLQQYLASQKAPPQQSAMAQAIAQMAGQQTNETNIEGQKIAQAGSKITQQGQLQMQKLQQQILDEKDPAKIAALQEKMQTLTGKYEKAAPAAKAVIEDYDTGKVDMMGQPIFKKRAINPETGDPISKPAAAAKPTKAQLDVFAKEAIAKGADPAAVKKRIAELTGQ